MPANLPPQYFEVEKKLRSAKDPAEKIEVLEEMLAIMPKHKGTDHLRADLRSKIAKLTQAMSKKSATRRSSLLIEKEGAAQVAIVGMPNTGKSQIIASITNASPAVADYPFTTQSAMPAMMQFENIKIQLIDTPPTAPDSYEFWLPPILQRADALLIVIDLSDNPLAQMQTVTEELQKMRIGIGISIPVAEEDVISHKKVLVVGSKLDMPNAGGNFVALQKEYGEHLPTIAISAVEGTGLEELKLKLFQILDIIRVYTKAPGQKAELTQPIVLAKGSTLEDAAADVHKDFAARLKYARVWGSGKHDGLRVKRDHILQDGDIVELHL